MDHTLMAKRLFTIYITAVLIIVALITAGQLIIQTTLYQEVSVRNLAFVMSHQTLRSQRLLRNAILAYAGPSKAFNPTNVDAAQQLADDLTFVETTNKQLLSTPTPSVVVSQVQQLQKDFTSSDTAAHKLLTDVKQYYSTKIPDTAIGKDATNQLAIIFLSDQNYLSGMYTIYSSISQQADDDVTHVQILEGVIYAVSLLVLCYEVFVVVIPAMRGYAKTMEELDNLAKKIQETTNQAAQPGEVKADGAT